MAIVNSYFNDFLSRIRLQGNHLNDLKTGHQTLRDRLLSDEGLANTIISTFLQGSYRRSTAVKPHGDKRADVDVVVVTNISNEEKTPDQALNLFVPFLEEHYKGKYQKNGRSIAIELSYVDLDLVVTSAPSEVKDYAITDSNKITNNLTLEETQDFIYKSTADWQLSPLLIPDRDAKEWTRTHPLEQLRWTQEKNKNCNGHYINVVKAIKWWQRIHSDELPKYPKGYPLEHLVGLNCPDGIDSIAEGVTFTLEAIANNYSMEIQNKSVPFLPDHGVPEHNVFKRIEPEEFESFHSQLQLASATAREALDSENIEQSVNLWIELFGNEFGPYAGGGSKTGGFSRPSAPPVPQTTQRFG